MRRLLLSLMLFVYPMTSYGAIHFKEKVHHHRSHLLEHHHRRYGIYQIGDASYYSFREDGKRTASGERYNPYRFTAASRTLPLGTIVRVEDLKNKRSVLVKINDRGPYADTRWRIIDLSRRAAGQLGMLKKGISRVKVSIVGRERYRYKQA
jgi:rare lipoprotein A